MKVITISSKGQVVLPAKVRRELNLGEGTKMLVKISRGMVLMKPITELSALRGVLSFAEKNAKDILAETRASGERKLKKLWAQI